ncbi:hypothetical protein RclHR1_22290003 [Rhizophagus clarus]|uniref:Uncharacterized protein n=1 Tax=Rhizophagus clarus TaxID=94130 RepID=A0A2Z6QYU8_9GLOM|nr:hypothetical protein RclHR1_22290003 [Rhizophagus clarus]
MPVRNFYNKVRRDAELLDYNNDIVVNQFLRGLNKDCIIEAERICIEFYKSKPKPKPKPQYHNNWELYAQNPYPDESSNLFNEDINHNDDDRHLHKIAKRIAKARKKYDDTELNKAMRELSLDDHDNSMNTSNTIRGMPIELVQADPCANVFFIQEEAVPELKLKTDKSIKHNIIGVSGLSEILGIRGQL